MSSSNNNTVPDEMIVSKIYFVCGQKVMLDRDDKRRDGELEVTICDLQRKL
ncbi:hypothetical protein SAMN05421820_105232 [Pedobacter steynii]|uniref:Uncharacterized protein n=1 Tax=Pedobacter steynii TaxID=430522 RepID=A0A1G9WPN5_9SPHI|nr:hypothetical protein SAMN05421820_105232 [Pedobacter steynii]